MIYITQHTHDSESPLRIDGVVWHDHGVIERRRRYREMNFADVDSPYKNLRGALEKAEQVFHWAIADLTTGTDKVLDTPYVPEGDLGELTRMLSQVIEGPHT